jgi:hypothetical protein
MKKLKVLLILFLCFSIKIQSQIDFLQLDCAHGHSCCSVGCRCCKEQFRPQKYDTISLKTVKRVKRTIISEHFQYALDKAKYPVRITFQYESLGSNKLESYFLPNLYYFSEHKQAYQNDKSPLLFAIEEFEKTGKIVLVDQKDNYVLLNEVGQKIPFQFHAISKVSNSLSIGIIKQSYTNVLTFLDKNLNQIGEMRYQEIIPINQNNYFLVRDFDRKYGIANEEGNVIIPVIYDEIRYIGHQLFSAQQGQQIVILSNKNIPITKEKYLAVREFSDGLAEVTNLKHEKAFIDSAGYVVFKHKFMSNSFANGLCSVEKDGKIGFMNKKGDLVIDFQFDRVRDFHQGVAPVALGKDSNKDKWGLIDVKGNFINDTKYDEIETFKNGLARVFINGVGYGFIDIKGNEVFKPIYRIEGYGSKNDYFIQNRIIRSTIGKNKSLEIVNQKGEQTFDLSNYIAAHFISDSKIPYSYLPYIMVYESDTTRNLIDFEGKKMLKNNYQVISIVGEDVAFVKSGGTQKLIRLSNEETILDFGTNKNIKFDGYFYEINLGEKIEIYNTKGEKIESLN